jgi:hypothetical protein
LVLVGFVVVAFGRVVTFVLDSVGPVALEVRGAGSGSRVGTRAVTGGTGMVGVGVAVGVAVVDVVAVELAVVASG